MDPSAVLALALSCGMILGGNALEGGHVRTLLQGTAFMIVIGGTLGATWLSSTKAELRLLRKLLPRLLKPNLADRAKLLEEMLRITGVVRRDGMLAFEAHLPRVENAMLRRGLQMVVDGNAVDDVKTVFETEIDLEEQAGVNAARLFDTAGGFAPTLGIMGAVLGLIHVMQNLSDPAKLGAGIAVAFVATLYGVGFANLVFLPVGARLRKIIEAEAEDRNMIITGIVGIAAGSNARQIGEMLAPWVGASSAEAGSGKRALPTREAA